MKRIDINEKKRKLDIVFIYKKGGTKLEEILKDEYLLEFNKLLLDYYNNGIDDKIIEFLYNNCIYGIEN